MVPHQHAEMANSSRTGKFQARVNADCCVVRGIDEAAAQAGARPDGVPDDHGIRSLSKHHSSTPMCCH